MSPEHSQEIADLDASLAQLVEPPDIQGDGGSSPSAGPQKGPASEARLIAQWKQVLSDPTHRENDLEHLKKKAQELKQELAKVETAIRWTQAMLGVDP